MSTLVSSSAQALTTPDELLSFWFKGYKNKEQYNLANVAVILSHWFFGVGGADFDAVQVGAKQLINNAENGLLTGDEWQTPQGYLARVILLDQFPRTVYKGTKEAFKFDPVAVSITSEVISKGWFQTKYTALEKFTFLLALLHSEEVEIQLLCKEHFEGMIESAKTDHPEYAEYFGDKSAASFAEHRDVVLKFGRYPSRNAALVIYFPYAVLSISII